MSTETRQARMDFGVMRSKPRRDGRGFLRVDGFPTRANAILKYTNADGSVRSEFRPPEEVFKADSLATLANAPVTYLHPSVMVTLDNFKSLQKGHLTEGIKQDGDFVAATLVLQDKDLIGGVERRDLCELSCGYTCVVDETPGVYKGQRYDCVQRDIKYNHVGVGPKGWGRAGAEVALHMDGVEGVTALRCDAGDFDFDNPEPTNGDDTMKLITIKIDGVSHEVPEASAENLQALIEKRDTALAAVQAKADTEKARADGLAKELEAAVDPAKMTAAVSSRVALETKARAVCGEAEKFDGKSDQEVKLATIKAADKTFDAAGKSEAYIDARFDMVDAPKAKDQQRKDARDEAARALALRQHNDGGNAEESSSEAAYKRMVKRGQAAWQPKAN